MPKSEDPKKVTNYNMEGSQNAGGVVSADTVNAQRIGGDIWNFFLGQQTTPVGNPVRPKNERLLLADVKQEVVSRLKQSLHNAVLINLEKESQPQQVKRPWDAEIKIGLKPAEPLPNTTTILQVFDSEEIAGKLLILGAPGAGKTTTQLELAKALVKRAEEQPDYPVPVLFNLSSWKDDSQSLTDWLMVELKSNYGVSTELSKKLLENHQLLPMLDGLDEVKPALQEACVAVINQLLQSECRPQYLVVCSRSQEYDNYETKLLLNGGICLKPFTKNQICDYLTAANRTELWQIINNDPDLLEIVKTPLLLGVTTLAFEEISIDDWQQRTTTTERLQFLFDAYVRRMLERQIDSKTYIKRKIPNPKQTQLWCVWLAQQLQKESKTEFLIEEMQPGWLDDTQGKMYRLIFWLILLLLGGLTTVLIYVLTKAAGGLKEGQELLFCVLLSPSALIELLIDIEKIKTVEIFQISWIEFIKSGEIFMVISTMTATTSQPFPYDPNSKLMGKMDIEKKIFPNQGIRKSAVNSCIAGSLWFLIGGLSNSLISEQGLVFGLIIGLKFGLKFGGNACLKHFILRLTLYFNGYTPWNYARFLDYSTERLFLQRVGGRYRFIHKMLQDHFAQMEFTHPK